MILSRKEIAFQEVTCPDTDKNPGMEGISIELATADDSLIVTNLYYPQSPQQAWTARLNRSTLGHGAER